MAIHPATRGLNRERMGAGGAVALAAIILAAGIFAVSKQASASQGGGPEVVPEMTLPVIASATRVPGSSALAVTLTPQPKLNRRSGRTNEVFTIGLVLTLLAFLFVEGFLNRPMLTGFFGAVAAFLLALVASLAAFGTTSNLKITARWRMVAAAELAEAAAGLGVTFPDALALLHSDEDSRSKTVEHLSFGRFMGDYFTCSRDGKRLTLHPTAFGWSLTVEPL